MSDDATPKGPPAAPARMVPKAPKPAAKGPIRPGRAPQPTNRPSPVQRPFPVRNNQNAPIGQSGVRALYIGPPITGKTTKMLTWPGVVFLQFDEERSVVDGSRTPVPVVEVSSWDHWEQVILPAIKTRKLQEIVKGYPGFEDYTVQTIAADSFTGMGELCESYCRSLESNTMRMYGEKLLKLKKTKDELFSITRPTPGLPTWNLIGAVHERALTRSVKGEDGQFKEITEGILPSITGGFGEKFLEYWSIVLWCYCDVPVNKDGDRLRDKSPLFYCRTDAIDQWRRGVDRLGGGRLPRLPSKVSGSYADLAKCWGIHQLTEKDNPNGQK